MSIYTILEQEGTYLFYVKAIRGTSTLDGREFPMDEMKIAIPPTTEKIETSTTSRGSINYG